VDFVIQVLMTRRHLRVCDRFETRPSFLPARGGDGLQSMGATWVPAFAGMTIYRIVVMLIVIPAHRHPALIVIPAHRHPALIVIPAKAGTQEFDSLQQLH
jgi:hypothetical protein